MGLTGEPVPPRDAKGAMVNRNSQRSRRGGFGHSIEGRVPSDAPINEILRLFGKIVND